MDGHQRDLPIAQAETSREAYAAAIAGCGLSPSATKIALWVVEIGEKLVIRIPADGGPDDGPDEINSGLSAPLPPTRKLADKLGRHHSSISRGLRELERARLAIRPAGRICLNLTRCCDLSEARATEREAPTFARGWRPGAAPAESEPGAERCNVVHSGAERCNVVQSGAERCNVVQTGASRGSAHARNRSEKQETRKNPEYLTETEPRGAAPDCTAPHQAAPGCTGADACGPLALLNRSPAWQALQAGDFADDAGRRCTPPLEKLRAAFRAAVVCGLVADDDDHKLRWLATVYDCAMHGRSPAGSLVWRTASGKLSWAGEQAWAWARRLLRRPPADDELVAATAAGMRLPEE